VPLSPTANPSRAGSTFVDPGAIELVREVTSVEDALLYRIKMERFQKMPHG